MTVVGQTVQWTVVAAAEAASSLTIAVCNFDAAFADNL